MFSRQPYKSIGCHPLFKVGNATARLSHMLSHSAGTCHDSETIMPKFILLQRVCAASALILCTAAYSEVVKKEIRFSRGTTGAIIAGAIVRGDQDQYTLGALAGQYVDARITSLEGNAVARLYAPGAKVSADGDVTGSEVGAIRAGSLRARLPTSGAYLIVVGSNRGNAQYSLSVQVQNEPPDAIAVTTHPPPVSPRDASISLPATGAKQSAPRDAAGSWSCDYGTAILSASGDVTAFDSRMERKLGLDTVTLNVEPSGTMQAIHSDGSGFQGSWKESTITAPKRSFSVKWQSDSSFYAITPISTVVREGAVHSLSLLCRRRR